MACAIVFPLGPLLALVVVCEVAGEGCNCLHSGVVAGGVNIASRAGTKVMNLVLFFAGF